MKTQYYTASSLDGFIADPHHSLEWLFPLGDVEATSYPTFIREVGALAMGSNTYEWMLRHVVGAQPWPYKQPTWVFTSRTLPPLPRTITTPPLRLVSVRAVGTGFAELHYEVPAPPR